MVLCNFASLWKDWTAPRQNWKHLASPSTFFIVNVNQHVCKLYVEEPLRDMIWRNVLIQHTCFIISFGFICLSVQTSESQAQSLLDLGPCFKMHALVEKSVLALPSGARVAACLWNARKAALRYVICRELLSLILMTAVIVLYKDWWGGPFL